MTSSVQLWGGVVLFCGLMVGCAPSSGPPTTMFHPPDNMSDQQKAAIDDDEITDDEYTAGFRAYQACMSEEGYELSSVERPSTVINWGVPAAGVTSGADERCYDENFIMIDRWWQIHNPPVTKYDALARACLAAEGLPTDGNIEELKNRMFENGLDINACFGIDASGDVN